MLSGGSHATLKCDLTSSEDRENLIVQVSKLDGVVNLSLIHILSVVSFSTLLCMIPFLFIESCVLRLISTGVVYISMFIFLLSLIHILNCRPISATPSDLVG